MHINFHIDYWESKNLIMGANVYAKLLHSHIGANCRSVVGI